MGADTETVAAGSGGKDKRPGCWKAHHVGGSAQEYRRGSKGAVGEG